MIAGTINRYIQIKGAPNDDQNFHIQLLDLEQEIIIDLTQNLNFEHAQDYFHSCIAILVQKGAKFTQGYTLEIAGTIPINAGVSSSSALVVAWLRFLIEAQDAKKSVPDTEIGKLAFEAEVIYFNQPGGLMDQYTIAQGGMLFIDTKDGITESLIPKMGTLILAESGIAKQTLSVLQNARSFAQKAIEEVKINEPEFDLFKANEKDYEKNLSSVSSLYKPYWYATIYNHLITQEAKNQLKLTSPDLVKLGSLMNDHQKILQECIQNTPPQMIEQMEAAKKAGAFGVKIIGSGGGGCMVALTNKDSKARVIKAFKDAGSPQAYEVEITSHS